MARPGYLTCLEKLEEHMPELVPVYQRLVKLAGNGDVVARYLSGYNPPPFMSGCSQLVWTKNSNSLIRNYDYDPKLFEGVLLKTDWLQPVIGISDCNWGLLDGINLSGLMVSLTFGGRNVSGDGFGIPLVLRYVLETCNDLASAQKVLMRLPVHMTYNVTLLDRSGSFCTIYLAPDRPPILSPIGVATNHQQSIEWMEYAAITGTLERKQFLEGIAMNSQLEQTDVVSKFLCPPLYHNNFRKAFVTLYTAVYDSIEDGVTIKWPGKEVKQTFTDFTERREIVNLRKAGHTELSR